jgi:hypothetical protein
VGREADKKDGWIREGKRVVNDPKLPFRGWGYDPTHAQALCPGLLGEPAVGFPEKEKGNNAGNHTKRAKEQDKKTLFGIDFLEQDVLRADQ